MELKDGLMDDIVKLRMDQMERENKQEDGEAPASKKRAQVDSDEEDLELFVRQWEKDFDRSNPNP